MPRKRVVKRRKRRTTDGGGRFVVSPHPPSFTAIPWYSLVVRIQSPPTTLNSALLTTSIESQLGIAFANAIINVRLQSIRVWGALRAFNDTSPLPPLSVAIYDVIAGTFTAIATVEQRVLDVLIDYPDMTRRAAVGYHYPKAQREVSLQISTTSPFTIANMSGIGSNSIVYVSLQWRPGRIGVIPVLDSEEEDIEVISDNTMRSTLVRGKDGKITSLSEKFARLGHH